MKDVVNPYSLDVIGSVAVTDWAAVDKALETAQQLYRARASWLPAHKRIDILRKAGRIMEDRQEELAYLIANEGGKPMVDARVEVTRAIDGVELCIHELSKNVGMEIPMDLTAAGAGRVAFTQRGPIGPVVAVSAFNHPLNLIVHQVGPAVAAGCPVIVKPADDTPLSCKAFVDILYEAGLPEEWCTMVVVSREDAERLVTDPRVAFFSFIGSARVGWMLRSKLAAGTRCALEHGGAAPVIVGEGAYLDAMIPALTKGGFYHSGQVCVSVQRVFAMKDQAAEIAERLAATASVLKVGNATDDTVDCGPLIRPREVTRVAEWVQEARDGGARLITGGEAIGDTAYTPTVLLDAPADATLSKAEIFGPVVSVYGVDSVDEAIARANSLDVAFQASVFTDKLGVAMDAVQQLDATAVMVNDHTAFRVDWMPFAGRRHSGYGTGGIGYTMHDMTQDKMAVIKL